jgi:hypothetical protein
VRVFAACMAGHMHAAVAILLSVFVMRNNFSGMHGQEAYVVVANC